MTTEVEDKKPEDCKKFESCHKMKMAMFEDKDLFGFQRRETALAICAKCDEFERVE